MSSLLLVPRDGEGKQTMLALGDAPGGTRAGQPVLWPFFSHVWTAGSVCLGEEGKVVLPISAAPVGPVSQQGNSPFIQQQKQSVLHLLMRDQQGSQEPAKTREPSVLRISTLCWVDLLFHCCFSQFRGLIENMVSKHLFSGFLLIAPYFGLGYAALTDRNS